MVDHVDHIPEPTEEQAAVLDAVDLKVGFHNTLFTA